MQGLIIIVNMLLNKNRDYSIDDCYKLHESIEKYVVPIWKQLGSISKKNLGVKTYRPWDLSPCNLPKVPFQNVIDLLNGVEEIFRKTDLYFYEKFIHIRKAGCIDVEERENKAPGAICFTLPHSKEVLCILILCSSFYAINALIHEVGHAFHFYKQFKTIVVCRKDICAKRWLNFIPSVLSY